jgi:hypothetical protein
MATNTAEFAWENAELRCFNYLLEATGTVKDDQAFLGNYPRTIKATENLLVWIWEINGGGDVVHIQGNNRPRPSWKMNARIRGIFTERKTAQEFCGRILNVVPYDDKEANPKMYGVQSMRPITEPMIEPDVMTIADDTVETGGDWPVWKLEWEFIVAFFNTERLA